MPPRTHFSAAYAACCYIAQCISLTLFLTSCSAPPKPLALEYLCDNGYYFSVLQSDDEAKVTLHGETQTLPRTISASGVRFATQDERYLFFSKGNMAHLEWNKIK
ncbi:MAG: MliC family protein, partial [Vibrionaceae bacterium]